MADKQDEPTKITLARLKARKKQIQEGIRPVVRERVAISLVKKGKKV